MPLAGAAGVNTRAGAKHKQEMSKRWADRAAKLQVPEKVPFDFSASRWNYVERLEAPKPSRVSWHVRSQWNANSSTGSVSRSRPMSSVSEPSLAQRAARHNRRPASSGSVRPKSSTSVRPQSSSSMRSVHESTPPDVWVAGGTYRGLGPDQWQWHRKHGRPDITGPRIPGAPWLPPDPTGVSVSVAIGAGMKDGLSKRRKSKMRALKYKMQAASYGEKGQDWDKLFSHYDKDGSGELDFEEFSMAVRRHGRMSVRTISDDEMREIFSIVDKDSGGTVSGQEFDEFLRNPDKGTKMKPALHRNFSKSRTALGIFNTQAGKGLGADGVTPPWARPQSAPGARMSTKEDWERDPNYSRWMTMEPPQTSNERVTFGGVELQEQASLPRRFLEGDAGQGARHRSAADLDKVWARERRKRENAATRRTRIMTKDGISLRADSKNLSINNVAHDAVAGVFAKFDADGSGSLGREELSRMGLDARKILASDGDGDGEITMEELAFYLDQQAAS